MSSEFWYDEEAAELVVDFFRDVLVHVKGEFAGRPLELEDWQADDIIRPLFGWKREDGTRQYQEASIWLPRKNGKSTVAAGLALYLTFCDNEPGAEVYSAAGDREQAGIVFGIASAMFKAARVLRKRGKAYIRSITNPLTESSYKVLSADAPRKHGFNAHGIIFDELHVQPNRRLWDVLTTSTGSRRQPLTISISTAGVYDKTSIAWERYSYAKRVFEGEIDDPTLLPVIYEAEPDADWKDPAVWAAANPNLGISVKREYLERKAAEAAEIPAQENTFRRLHLGQWTEQVTRWLSMDVWHNGDAAVDPDALKGRECFAGLDLSATRDLSAFVLVFAAEDDKFDVLPDCGSPEERSSEADFEAYSLWIREGYLEATPGNVIDHGRIRAKINELGADYSIREIAFDPWNAAQIASELSEQDGFELVKVRQGTLSLNEPTRLLERLLLQSRIRHGANPVLAWNASNVAVYTDRREYIRPDKARSTGRIDGIVALVMALGRAAIHGEGSVYEGRGILVV